MRSELGSRVEGLELRVERDLASRLELVGRRAHEALVYAAQAMSVNTTR